jgi:hypothetical protein
VFWQHGTPVHVGAASIRYRIIRVSGLVGKVKEFLVFAFTPSQSVKMTDANDVTCARNQSASESWCIKYTVT